MNSQVRRLAVLLLSIAFALSPLLSSGFGGFYPESFPVQVERWPMQPAGWGILDLGRDLSEPDPRLSLGPCATG